MEVPIYDRIRRMEPSLATLLILTVGAIAAVGLIAVITAPSAVLVGDSQWEIISAFHGLGATVFLLGATIAVYLSWRLYTGQLSAFKDLKWLTAFSSVMSAVTIGFGNWIYIGYRLKSPTGDIYPREFFLGSLPAIHEIFFEFKEFIALFTLPLMVAATFLLWKYGAGLVKNKELRAVVSVPMLLGWVFLILAYTLGAAITKLKGVP